MNHSKSIQGAHRTNIESQSYGPEIVAKYLGILFEIFLYVQNQFSPSYQLLIRYGKAITCNSHSSTLHIPASLLPME